MPAPRRAATARLFHLPGETVADPAKKRRDARHGRLRGSRPRSGPARRSGEDEPATPGLVGRRAEPLATEGGLRRRVRPEVGVPPPADLAVAASAPRAEPQVAAEALPQPALPAAARTHPPGRRVVDRVATLGRVTACLARLGTHVDTVEWFEDLSVRAQSILEKLEIQNASFFQGDALSECADQQYDVIAVTASMPVYLDVFESRLAADGRMFVVTGHAPAMQAQLLTRVDPKGLHCTTLFETSLPPLLGLEEPGAFQL